MLRKISAVMSYTFTGPGLTRLLELFLQLIIHFYRLLQLFPSILETLQNRNMLVAFSTRRRLENSKSAYVSVVECINNYSRI